jgi:hypothetical protein
MAANNLFIATDADNDPLTYYLLDNTSSASSGHFVVNGTVVPAGSPYAITATQLAQTTFVAGAGGISDDLFVIASDGKALSGSQYTEFHVNVDRAPVLTVPSVNVAATAGQTIAALGLFSATDADNDPLTYFLLDNTTAADSGHFVFNGSPLSAGVTRPLTAAQMAQVTFVAGGGGTSDDIFVIASDGHLLSNSDYKEFHINVANHAPALAVPSTNVSLAEGHSTAAFNLFRATDADNDSLTYYLLDNTTSANSGHFVFNGSPLSAGVTRPLTAAQMAQTTFVAGSAGVSDDIYVIASDGHALSDPDYTKIHVTATPNHAPVLTVPSANVAATAGQTIAALSLFSATDADNDALTYFLLDNTTAADSGHFMFNGSPLSAGVARPLTAAQMAQVTFVAGGGGSSDDIFVIASDGQALSGPDYIGFHIFV